MKWGKCLRSICRTPLRIGSGRPCQVTRALGQRRSIQSIAVHISASTEQHSQQQQHRMSTSARHHQVRVVLCVPSGAQQPNGSATAPSPGGQSNSGAGKSRRFSMQKVERARSQPRLLLVCHPSTCYGVDVTNKSQPEMCTKPHRRPAPLDITAHDASSSGPSQSWRFLEGVYFWKEFGVIFLDSPVQFGHEHPFFHGACPMWCKHDVPSPSFRSCHHHWEAFLCGSTSAASTYLRSNGLSRWEDCRGASTSGLKQALH
jgi:hypothetical protein